MRNFFWLRIKKSQQQKWWCWSDDVDWVTSGDDDDDEIDDQYLYFKYIDFFSVEIVSFHTAHISRAATDQAANFLLFKEIWEKKN